MKAEAVWAEAPTGEGAPTWDTERRAVLRNPDLDGRQVGEFSTRFLLSENLEMGAPGPLRSQENPEHFFVRGFSYFR